MNIPKFRAYDKVSGEVFEVVSIDFERDYVVLKSKYEAFCACLDEVEIMQYTGLKDKNGVEIFEGDIFTHKNNHKFVVKWDEDRFVGLDNKRNGDGYCCYISSCDKSGNSTIEVIGNIYENSELMERV